MAELLETVDSSVMLLQEDVAGPVDATRLFGRLADRGRRNGSVLLESGEIAPTYAERSFGVCHSSLCIQGKDQHFAIMSLDERGRAMLPLLRKKLPKGTVVLKDDASKIEGELLEMPSAPDFSRRLRSIPALDLLRAALPACAGPAKVASAVGLYGCFAFDFVRQLEDLPRPQHDVLSDPDYVFFLPARLFVTDHLRQCTSLISLIPDDRFYDQALSDLREMRAATQEPGDPPSSPVVVGEIESDVTKNEFCRNVELIKQAIAQGRAYQVVYGRMLQAPFHGDALEVYRRLKRRNPSPYMFYARDERGVLLGASPELAVRVGDEAGGKKVEIRPIAGTKPRGRSTNGIDESLDERLAASLKVDPKELAEHTMLIDLARNDIASISEPGTVRLEKSFVIEKYSHVQHLVSQIGGVLRRDLDAFNAYAATMNMGTLTGAPKHEAMKIISEVEKSSRGLFGGAVGMVSSSGELETAIIIRALRIIGGRVYIRAGAGIVADSIAEQEWFETAQKAEACLLALGGNTL